jgi:diacylglycerol O-acyltransferase
MSGMTTRLSAHDSVFLNWERPEQPMHVAECMVYEGHLTADDMIEMIRDRIHLLPRYRQRVVGAPLGLAHPTWEDDPDFDVAHHVAEQDLPDPANDRALSRVCGDLFCDLLDRDRPLWHLTVLHGYLGGGTVVFLKLHHSMVDGVSSVELIEVLHSTQRGATAPPPPAVGWEPRPLAGPVDRLRDVVVDQMTLGVDALRGTIEILRPGGIASTVDRGIKWARATLDLAPGMLSPLPSTPFNHQIHARRDFAWVELSLEEAQRVRRALGGSVNDLVLAVLSGALGRHMARYGDSPEGRELRAMCPVSVRRASQSGAMGNLISMVVVPLHVGVQEGGERLIAEREAMQALKARGQADGIYEVIAAMKWVPAPLFALIWKLWPRDYFPMHITSTNVPGPREPLFLGDHELLHWYPFGVQWTNNALFLCTLSYRGRLVLGPVSDPEIVHDVWEFAEDLRASYEEIRDAAGVQSVGDNGGGRRTSRTGKAAARS